MSSRERLLASEDGELKVQIKYVDEEQLSGMEGQHIHHSVEVYAFYTKAFAGSIAGLVISNSLAEFLFVGNLVNFVYSHFATSAVIVSVKEGMTSFMAIVGATIADAYIGSYFVVLASTALFIYGLLLISVTELFVISRVALPCIAVAFIAAGQGGQEHTLRKFGADQFTEHMEDKDKAIHHSRVWWYMGAFVGATAGLVLAVLLSKSDSGSLETDSGFLEKMYFLSPPITMVVAFYVAALGSLFYYRAKPRGSPLARMLRVLVASAWKARLDYPMDESKIHGRVNPCSTAVCAKNESNGDIDVTRTPAALACIGSGHLRSASLKENQVLQRNENMMHNERLPPFVKQGDDTDKGALFSPYDSEASLHPSPPDVLSSTKGTHCLLHPSYARYEASAHPLPPFDLESAKNGVEKELFWLPHTNRLRWLDKAAIIDEPATTQVSKWRLCTQTEVEETKYLFSFFPIWATFLMYGMVLSLGKTFFIAQANTLSRKFNHRFQIPTTSLLAVSGLSKLVVTKTCPPLLNWFTGLGSGVYPRIRIGVGFLLSTLCCLIAYFVETRRLHIAKKTGRPAWFFTIDDMSIFWLVPQFCALGAMDGLVEDAIADLFVDQVPAEQLWRCKTAFCESVKGMGSMLGALMILMTKTIRPDWFADDIKKNHVDRYYFVFFVLSLTNLFVYGIVARRYPCNAHRNQHQSESGKGCVKRPVACLETISGLLF